MSSHENALPKAVQEQISKADELYKSLYEQSEESAEESAKEPADEQPTKPAEQEPEQKVEPVKEPAKEPAKDSGFEHKFNVLKGKYDKEVPRLHRQLRDAERRNSELSEQITALRATVEGLKTAAAEPEPQPSPITDEERDQFGPDLIDLIQRVVHSETGVILDKSLKPVKQQMEQVNEKVAKTNESVALSAREQMLKDLTDAVPNWRKQNEDEGFLEWLDETDPYSGKQRAELLAEAYNANNTDRVVALFKGFQKENAVVTPSDQQPQTPAEEQPAKDEKGKQEGQEQPDGLSELVAPGTPKTGSAGAQNESGKKIWTQREIQEFYAYKNEFIKRNPERELPENIVRLERDLFDANKEGRIRG